MILSASLWLESVGSPRVRPALNHHIYQMTRLVHIHINVGDSHTVQERGAMLPRSADLLCCVEAPQ